MTKAEIHPFISVVTGGMISLSDFWLTFSAMTHGQIRKGDAQVKTNSLIRWREDGAMCLCQMPMGFQTTAGLAFAKGVPIKGGA